MDIYCFFSLKFRKYAFTNLKIGIIEDILTFQEIFQKSQRITLTSGQMYVLLKLS